MVVAYLKTRNLFYLVVFPILFVRSFMQPCTRTEYYTETRKPPEEAALLPVQRQPVTDGHCYHAHFRHSPTTFPLPTLVLLIIVQM